MSGVGAPPLPRAPAALRLPERQRIELDNGVPVVLVERHELPIVDLRLVVRTGAAADAPELAGRMTLLADMLDEGTEARSALEISDTLEYLGAELRLGATWDASTVALHVLRPRLEAALDVVADVVRRPAFPEDDLSRKREERLAHLIQQKDEPDVVATQAFTRLLYGDAHPYGAPALGTEHTVRRLTREAMLEAYARHYRPGNTFLVVAGDVNADELRALLAGRLGDWAGAAERVDELPEPANNGGGSIRVLDRPGAAQSEIRVGQVGVARTTPDYFALLVMNTVLGGSFTSRLNMNLRQDKGYTYGAGCGFHFRRAAGPFIASAAVDTAVTADAVREFLREMHRIRDEPVPDDELERAKNYIAWGLPRRFERAADIAYRLADVELHGLGDDYYDTYVSRVRAVKAEHVERVARRYLQPERWAVVIAGDRERTEPGLRALGAGEFSIVETEDGE